MLILRIDDRLIHTQIISGWAEALQLQRIIVANDAAARDIAQAMVLKMAAPPQLDCVVCQPENITSHVQDNVQPYADNANQLIIVASITCAWRVMQKIPLLSEINLANCGCRLYKTQWKKLAEGVFLNPDEYKLFLILCLQGIRIIHQPSPWIALQVLSATGFTHPSELSIR